MKIHGTLAVGASLFAAVAANHTQAGEVLPKTTVYQGQLKLDGKPVNDVCDFTFTLFSDAALSVQVDQQWFNADPEADPPLPVVNGLFQAPLDFGDAFATGGPMFLQIQVRCPAGAPEPMSTLTPATPITPVPFAYHAEHVESPDGHSLDASDGTPVNALYVDEIGEVGIGTASPSAALHLVNNGDDIGIRLKASGSWTAELRQTNASILSLINGGSERLSITAGGRVGIGTTSPTSTLDVISGSDPMLTLRTSDLSGDDAGLRIQGARNASTSADVAYIDFRDFDSDEGAGGTTFSMARISGGLESASGQRGNLRFYTGDGGTLTEHMRIDAFGRVGIGTSSPVSDLHILSDGEAALRIEGDADGNGDEPAQLLFRRGSLASAEVGFVGTSDDFVIAPRLPSSQLESHLLLNPDGNVGVGSNSPTSGKFQVVQSEDDSGGGVAIVNSSGQRALRLWVDGSNTSRIDSASGGTAPLLLNSGGGRVDTGGPLVVDRLIRIDGGNGNSNILLSHLLNNPDNGFLSVDDPSGNPRVRAYVDTSDQGWVEADQIEAGEIAADVKNFRVPNPADPATDIYYASLEGPEAAAYVRGTARLVAGRAVIELPDHFQSVAVDRGMTVNVTPLSAESAGLAVTEKNTRRVVVRELNGGTGSYAFDYMVTAVRQGHENYRVIRPRRAPARAQVDHRNGPDQAGPPAAPESDDS